MNKLGISARKPAVHRFHAAYVELGIDTDTLYAELGIDPAIMASEEGTLGMEAYFSLLHSASRMSGIRFLSATLAPTHKASDMGILVYLIRNARNFEQAIDILQRYVVLISPGSEIALIEQGQDYVLTYKFPGTPAAKCYQDVEGTIVQFVLMIRDVLRDDAWQPDNIYFAHPELLEGDAVRFPFGDSVVFDHSFSGVAFPRSVIYYPIEDSDPKLLSILEAQVLESAAELIAHNTLSDRIRLLISSGLGSGTTAGDIAEALNMSRRTLHRRLNESGVSYSELREEIVLDLAKSSLTNSTAAVAHIAQNLGYSDSSAFNRVFKRLSGHTPLQYRRKHTRR